MAMKSIRNKRSLCELNVPFDNAPITYNRFAMPEGSIVQGKDVSGSFFYPVVAEVDAGDADYCIARYPANYNVELNKTKIEDGIVQRDRVLAKPYEIIEAISASEIVREAMIKEGYREEEVKKEKSIEKSAELKKDKDEDLGEEI